MASFTVKFRKTGPLTNVVVDAPNRDAAVAHVVYSVNPDEQVEVFGVEDGVADGVTGATGATGR